MSLSPEVFAERRRRFVTAMEPESVAIFFAAPVRVRNNDVHYRYRQDSDFFYLTGFSEEDAVLILGPDLERLYLRPRDRSREIWDGPRSGIEEAVEQFRLREARELARFEIELPELLKNRGGLYYSFGFDEKRDGRILGAARSILQRPRGGDYGPTRILSPEAVLHEMRLIKQPEEVALLQEAAAVTAAGHIALIEGARPGMYEYELEAILLYEFRRRQAEEGYPSIVASGPNACILHHIRNDRRLEEGDLVLVDAGAERNFITADVTRTWPVSGRFSAEQREVYQAVLDAQLAAIAATQPGATLDSVHDVAVKALCERLLMIGVLSGSLDEILEKKSYRSFYMHRTGHWLGSDVHDVGPYYDRGAPRRLAPGMVSTVEPGLYFSPEEPACPERFRGIGVRIEDDVLVSANGPVVLTAAIPKQIAELEGLRLTPASPAR